MTAGRPAASAPRRSPTRGPENVDTSFPRRALWAAVLALWAAAATAALAPAEVHRKTQAVVLYYLSQGHYRRLALDDALSAQVFEDYLDRLDPQRLYFLAADIEGFQVYRHRLDDALKAGDLRPAYEIFNRYQQRLQERLAYLLARVEAGLDRLDFERDESLEVDRRDAPWPATRAALDELWRKRLKNDVLNLKLAGKSLEDIGPLLRARYQARLEHARRLHAEDAFETYINALAQRYDPHTEYLSPLGSENFNINMSLSLEGIGAVLQTDNEYTKVVRLVPAGPADRSGLLRPADRIVAVGQGEDGEMVNVIGWRLDDVVRIIRGPKRTVVRLEILPADAGRQAVTRTIRLVRDTVRLEEQSAKKSVFELEREGRRYRIGVIRVPTFYLDFKAMQANRPDYRSTTRDVRRLLRALQAEDIDGLIVDLRDNSGGSLQEARSMLGLFVDTGPTVQVRNVGGEVEVLDGLKTRVVYRGPLAVLVNRLSASASEIFAGAIQDYGRGLIIGGRTFGKGTVQSLFTLDHGQLKITQSKFYRVSGGSTQHRGVTPDVAFPPLYDREAVGESALDNALEWDSVRPIRHVNYFPIRDLRETLRRRHQARVAHDPDFRFLLGRLKLMQRLNARKTVSLREADRRRDQESLKRERLALENQRRIAKGEPPLDRLAEAAGKPRSDDGEPDALLREGGEILVDYIRLAPAAVPRVAGPVPPAGAPAVDKRPGGDYEIP